MLRLLRIALLALAAFWAPGLEPQLIAAPVVLVADSVDASPASEVLVPIRVRDAQGMGAVQFHLVYDARVLEWKGAELSSEAGTGVVDVKVVAPGRVRVALVLGESGLQGERRLLDTRFSVTGQPSAEAAIEVAAARAWTQQDIVELLVETQAGRVQVLAPGTALPLTWILMALAILVVLGLAVFLRRRPTVSAAAGP